jgi:hypothetical protein
MPPTTMLCTPRMPATANRVMTMRTSTDTWHHKLTHRDHEKNERNEHCKSKAATFLGWILSICCAPAQVTCTILSAMMCDIKYEVHRLSTMVLTQIRRSNKTKRASVHQSRTFLENKVRNATMKFLIRFCSWFQRTQICVKNLECMHGLRILKRCS